MLDEIGLSTWMQRSDHVDDRLRVLDVLGIAAFRHAPTCRTRTAIGLFSEHA